MKIHLAPFPTSSCVCFLITLVAMERNVQSIDLSTDIFRIRIHVIIYLRNVCECKYCTMGERRKVYEKDSTCALYNKNECKLFFKYIYIRMAVINKVWKIAKTCCIVSAMIPRFVYAFSDLAYLPQFESINFDWSIYLFAS